MGRTLPAMNEVSGNDTGDATRVDTGKPHRLGAVEQSCSHLNAAGTPHAVGVDQSVIGRRRQYVDNLRINQAIERPCYYTAPCKRTVQPTRHASRASTPLRERDTP